MSLSVFLRARDGRVEAVEGWKASAGEARARTSDVMQEFMLNVCFVSILGWSYAVAVAFEIGLCNELKISQLNLIITVDLMG